MDQTLKMSLLLDTYGGLLTEKQRACVDLYYNQDLSLAEIAESEGISRQGVHDSLARAEAAMLRMEQQLGCLGRELRLQGCVQSIRQAMEPLRLHPDPAVQAQAEAALVALSLLKE